MTTDQIQNEIAKYKWYHRIEVAPGIVTPGVILFDQICDFIARNVALHDYEGKSVLDVGARDCLHSLRAERMGAASVTAIDNDISAGARDFVLPLLGSKVQMRHQNLYDVPEKNHFDIVQFFGVLYHLRFPFNGLKKMAEATKVGGTLMIEGGFLVSPAVEKMEMLWCPAPERSPYDPSSVTFFNACAMDATLKTLGCEPIAEPVYWEPSGAIRRGFFTYRRTAEINHGYWEGLHDYHTRAAHANADWKPDQK